MNDFINKKLKIPAFSFNNKKEPNVEYQKQWLINNGYSELIDLLLQKNSIIEFVDELHLFYYNSDKNKCIICNNVIKSRPSYWGTKRWALTCSKKCAHKHRSNIQKGQNNTVHRQTLESKKRSSEKQSNTMKNLIITGKFTPVSKNYLNHGNIKFYLNNKLCSVRSSWEMLFWFLHPNLEYEKIRLEYITNNNKKIYITDFYDKQTNTIYEIKPTKYFYTMKDKLQSIKNYNFIHINENYFKTLQNKQIIKEELLKQVHKDDIEIVKRRLKYV